MSTASLARPAAAPMASRAAHGSRRAAAFRPCAVLAPSPRASPDRPRSSKLPVLGLISAAVESQAHVQRFEQFAGRSAMVGFLVALGAEGLTEQTVFTPLDLEQAYVALGTVAAAVSAAVALAAQLSPPLGADLKEAVISSCTAARRSASSVTGAQVDKALDALMEGAFSMRTLYALLSEDLL